MNFSSINRSSIFPAIVIIISIISFIDNLSPIYYFSLIVSLIGIIGGVLYFKNKAVNTHLLEIWPFAQIPYLTRTIFATASTPELLKKIIDASQVFSIPIGLNFSSTTEKDFIGINILPLIVIGILVYFKLPYQKKIG
ncbi:MAG: hypothetical protein GC192_10705 [Bacteroidetes bacterium]|nr:hypothetical protein [Bacteroidota bacterium]